MRWSPGIRTSRTASWSCSTRRRHLSNATGVRDCKAHHPGSLPEAPAAGSGDPHPHRGRLLRLGLPQDHRADSTHEVQLITSQLLIVVTFMYSGVLALSAAVVAGPLI